MKKVFPIYIQTKDLKDHSVVRTDSKKMSGVSILVNPSGGVRLDVFKEDHKGRYFYGGIDMYSKSDLDFGAFAEWAFKNRKKIAALQRKAILRANKKWTKKKSILD